MKKQQFSIQIKAFREKVWNTLWSDRTLRDWASIIDEGMYMVGELKEGSEVQFISSVGGYGVTSLVEKLSPGEFVTFRHMADTEDSGSKAREKEWTGGGETYSLSERDGITTLTLNTDIPPEQEEMMKVRYPQALERIKYLAENKNQ